MRIEEIGRQTQGLIVATMKRVNSGKVKSVKQAVTALKRIPPSKFEEALDAGYLAATLAGLRSCRRRYGFGLSDPSAYRQFHYWHRRSKFVNYEKIYSSATKHNP